MFDTRIFHHVGSMRLDGLNANLESLTNFLVLKPGPNQFNDFFLSTSK